MSSDFSLKDQYTTETEIIHKMQGSENRMKIRKMNKILKKVKI